MCGLSEMRFDPDFGLGKFLKLYLYKFVLRITLFDSAPIFFPLSSFKSLCFDFTHGVLVIISDPGCYLFCLPSLSAPPPSLVSWEFTSSSVPPSPPCFCFIIFLRLLLSVPRRIPSFCPAGCMWWRRRHLFATCTWMPRFPRPRACTVWRVRLGVGLQGGSVPPSQ